MADENNQQQPNPSVSQSGGTKGVQFPGNPEERAQEEANRNNQVDPQEKPQRPEGLPEGFDSWEDAYKDAVEKAKAPAKEEGPEALSAEQQAELDAALNDMPEESRDKAKPFFEEYARTGDLSDQSVKDAAKAFGVSEAVVRQYVGNSQAADVVGATQILGEAKVEQTDWDAFSAWANDGGYTAHQLETFNSGLTKDPAKTVAEAVKAWKEAGHGPAPRDITKGERPGHEANDQGPAPYASIAEMQRDMNDPKYAKDEAFRKKVEARVGASDFGLTRGR